MFLHSALRELELGYTKLRRAARVGETTMREILHGDVWGSRPTRRRLTWHLLVFMLVHRGLEDTVTFVESGGDWLPDGIPEPVWRAEDGRIHEQSAPAAATSLRPLFVRLVVVLPPTTGPNGHRAHPVTLDWSVKPPPATP